ncbi:aglC [Symbiodinium natans]|uniref:AglC protein n=1 Tax=Symbiodinium natans TaxID=878477 RepID=A0A812RMG9_9DINO|nr:aglC [Symbiodinium natans]
MAGLVSYFMCLARTCLALSPFVALLTRKMETSDFVACTEGCVFIRYAGVPTLPATAVENVELSTGNFSGWWTGFPLFVQIQNGQALRASYPVLSVGSWLFTPGAMYGILPSCFTYLTLQLDASSRQAFETSASAMQCEDETVREKIENHLAEGRSRFMYLLFIVMWSTLTLAHDWGLLNGLREVTTIRIGLASWYCQSLACVAAFVWATGAVEVFIAPGSGCYYQLNIWQTMFTILPPLLLLAATELKLTALALSVCHGDYMYSITYSVPYRMVSAVRPQEPTADLLTLGLRGDRDMPYCRPPPLSLEELHHMEKVLFYSGMCWTFVQHFVIAPFTFGPLLRRLISVAMIQDWSLHALGLLKLAVAMLLAICVVIGIYPVLASRYGWLPNFSGMCDPWDPDDQEEQDDPWQDSGAQKTSPCNWSQRRLVDFVGRRVLDAFCCLFGPAFSLGALAKLISFVHAGETDELEQSWSWYLHGTSAFIFASYTCSLLPAFRNPRVMLATRTLQLDFSQSYRLLREVAATHPEWAMEAHVDFLCQMPPAAAQRLRATMLEDSDGRRSHVDELGCQRQQLGLAVREMGVKQPPGSDLEDEPDSNLEDESSESW